MISAILLAAGSSKRMGEVNKLLLPFKGETFIHRVARNLLDADIGEVIVVTGHEPDKVKEALFKLPVSVVHNPFHLIGMTGSIQQGVAIAQGAGFMICLADMILIEPGEYHFLAQSFNERLSRDPDCICMPTHQGVKGNPVIFAASYRGKIMHHDESDGCRGIVQAHKSHVVHIPMETPHILQDIDLPGDYEAILSR